MRIGGAAALAAAALSAALLASCPQLIPSGVEREVKLNAAWSEDYGSILLITGAYREGTPGAPYWNTLAGHADWRARAYVAGPDLSNPVRVAEWDDSHHDAANGLLGSVTVFWYRGGAGSNGTLFYTADAHATVRNLITGGVAVLELPAALEKSLVWDPLNITPQAGEHPDPMYLVPSPNGLRVAVHFQVTVGGTGPYDLLFRHVYAVFTLGGDLVGAQALDWDTYKTEEMRLYPPDLVPPLPNADPPAVPVYSVVPALYPSHLVWKKDSSGFIVAAKPGGNPQALLFTVEPSTLSGPTALTYVPAVALPTSGGAVSQSGELLEKDASGGDNATDIRLYQLSGWTPFETAGDAQNYVSATSAAYLP